MVLDPFSKVKIGVIVILQHFLIIGDIRLALRFDCAACEMTVHAV